jgi:hypothetical protein
MNDKRGFLKVVEAFIAIILIGGVLTFIYVSEIRQPQQEDYIYQLLRLSLKEISNTEDLRTAILSINSDNLGNVVFDKSTSDLNAQKIAGRIGQIIPQEYEFKFKICELEDSCGLDNLPQKTVFSEEVSVSSLSGGNVESRKIRIFVWSK